MKLGLEEDSLRLQLYEAEVAEFAHAGEARCTIVFGAAQEWTDTNRVKFFAVQVVVAEGHELRVVVEKDWMAAIVARSGSNLSSLLEVVSAVIVTPRILFYTYGRITHQR